MKKVLTILAIMIVAACAVFAETAPTQGDAETHKLTVQSTVPVVVPGFSFQIGSLKTNNNTATDDGSTANAFAADAEYDLTAAAGTTGVYELTDQDISKEDVTATFEIWSNRVCNYNGKFLLTVSATNFKGENDKITNASLKKHEFAAKTGMTNISAQTGTDKVDLEVTYAGRQEAASVQVGSVTLTWNKDTTAIPQKYVSDVTLTVTAK